MFQQVAKTRGAFLIAIVAVLSLSGCTVNVNGNVEGASTYANTRSFAISIQREELGAGANPLLASAVPTGERGDAYVSEVLIQALQDLELGIEVPNLNETKYILPNESWATSVRLLTPDLIAAHNAESAVGKLPMDRIYGLRYVGRYYSSEDFVNFRISSELYSRGAGESAFTTPFRSNDYSGNFFLDIFESSVTNRFSLRKNIDV
ncbi:hypothetical protein J7399_14460 [Shimia sp. R9_1]|uniref:hypothetical protein n=1 Tax=Shimia sp. R9_1 TaxID=2821111 RepID=UPI001ADBC813|nr:hypothetical protein [Shimia sp. R9_1]MBO9408637.1 hypothetical protein [Shimia sp. R9_1]